MTAIVRLSIRTGSININPLNPQPGMLGGRGLTSSIISQEVPPYAHPLGSGNKIIFAPGLLSGTSAPCSGRLSVGAKSPLTNGIKEANAGGTAAQLLARLGIAALVLEGIPPKESGWFIIKIGARNAEFLPADRYVGLGNYELHKKLRKVYGDKTAIISIGTAGEQMLSTATIAVSDMDCNPTRHAARGGLGAVLGSKRIKAIVIDNDKKNVARAADEYSFKTIVKDMSKDLAEGKKVLTQYGTANLVNVINQLDGLPTYNFTGGNFAGAEMISGETLRKLVLERGGKVGHPCHAGCVIRCSNVFHDKQGAYLTAGLEYETIALLGANCGIDDLDTIAQLDRRCDDYGLDTMEIGVAIGVAMEAGVLKFGDKEGILHLVDEIGQGTSLGRIIGSGAKIVGQVYGLERVPVVKGQGLSGYDPRVFKGTAVTYMTSPMGADHTAGNCLPGRGGYQEEVKQAPQIFDTERQGLLSHDLQVMATVLDTVGLCNFTGTTYANMQLISRLLNTYYGWNINVIQLLELYGQNILDKERNYNEKAGINRAFDRLPRYFYQEALPGGQRFDLPDEEIEEAY